MFRADGALTTAMLSCLARKRWGASRGRRAARFASQASAGLVDDVVLRADRTGLSNRPPRAHTERVPDDAPWIGPVVVPDDLRELQDDIEAYHRELRTAARRRRFERLTSTRAWRRLIFPITVTTGLLAVAAVVFAVLTVGQPDPGHRPVATATASAPAAAVGRPGGLLPDVQVSTANGPMSIRSLRPALVAMVPAYCSCTTLLADLAAQADEAKVPLVVVAPMAQDAEIAALAGQLHRGDVVPAFDAHAALATTYAADGVTVLVVAPDATVSYLQSGVKLGVRLELPLQQIASLAG